MSSRPRQSPGRRQLRGWWALAFPGTGMVVTLDCGDAGDLHPTRKQVVGDRLARLALARHYGQAIACDGPRVRGVQRQGASLRVEFDCGRRTGVGAACRAAAPTGSLRNGAGLPAAPLRASAAEPRGSASR